MHHHQAATAVISAFGVLAVGSVAVTGQLPPRDHPPPDPGAAIVISSLDDLEPTDSVGRRAAEWLDFPFDAPLEPNRLPWWAGRRPFSHVAPLADFSERFLRRIAICDADAIIVGRVAARRVVVNHSRTILLTVNEISALRRLYSPSRSDAVHVVVVGGLATLGKDRYETPRSTPRVPAHADLLMLLRADDVLDGLYLPKEVSTIKENTLAFRDLAGSVDAVLDGIARDLTTCGELGIEGR